MGQGQPSLSVMRKSRSRSTSEPEIPQGIRRKTYQEDDPVMAPLVSEPPVGHSPTIKDESWVGSVKNFVWNLWSQNDDGNASEDSKSDFNLSEYEERIRRNRDLPAAPNNSEHSATPSIAIPSRLNAKPNSPVLSPRNSSPYLNDGDYGIKLSFPSTVKADELLMTNELISKLHSGLPSRWRIANNWELLYSTSLHGFSLNTLFGKSRGNKDPVVAVIKDSNGGIFGAFATEPWHPHIGHFGTGECFLWRLEASEDGQLSKVRRWKSTGENDYYMLCETGFIAAGCGDGKFGLWLDAQLERGNSHSVPTFGNEPLAKSEHFVCMSFELWGLVLDE